MTRSPLDSLGSRMSPNQDDEHFVDGDHGASAWTLSGTTTEGQRVEIRGCDLWILRDGKVVKKDSFWKIRTSA